MMEHAQTDRQTTDIATIKEKDDNPRFVKGLGERTRKFIDKYLRDFEDIGHFFGVIKN